MATYHGKEGAIKKNSVAVAQVQNWRIDVSTDLHEKTSFGDDWKSRASGLNDWKGTFDMILDMANTEQKAIHDALVSATGATKLTDMVFFIDGTGGLKKFSGDIWINGFSITTAVADLVKAAVTFTGDGAMTYSAT